MKLSRLGLRDEHKSISFRVENDNHLGASTKNIQLDLQCPLKAVDNQVAIAQEDGLLHRQGIGLGWVT